MRTLNVYRNMYSGMSFEESLKSEMMGMGVEAHKPSVDICFDVTAYCQQSAIFPESKMPLTKDVQLWFQVKSATVFENEGTYTERMLNAGLQKNIEKEFYFKEEELEVIMNTDNSFIVCYFGDKDKKPLIYFWLDSSQIKELYYNEEATYFYKKPNELDKIFLRANFQSQIDATEKITERLNKAIKEVTPNQKGLEYLLNSTIKTIAKTTVLYNEPSKVILMSENKKKTIILEQSQLSIRNIFPI